MSQQYDVKRLILKLIGDTADKKIAASLFLEAIGLDPEDFEFDNDQTAEQYLFED